MANIPTTNNTIAMLIRVRLSGKLKTKSNPPAQAMSKVVPLKDWNDVVIPKGASDKDYKVSLYRRKSVKRGKPVLDATLTPIPTSGEHSA